MSVSYELETTDLTQFFFFLEISFNYIMGSILKTITLIKIKKIMQFLPYSGIILTRSIALCLFFDNFETMLSSE